MVEKTYSYRTSDEKFIDYINTRWNGSFSKFVNSVKEKEFLLMKNNRVKNFLNTNISSVILIGLGAILMLFSLYTFNLMVFIICLFLGGFLLIYGIIMVYLEVISHWKPL